MWLPDQVVPMLPVSEPHLENHCCRVLGTKAKVQLWSEWTTEKQKHDMSTVLSRSLAMKKS